MGVGAGRPVHEQCCR